MKFFSRSEDEKYNAISAYLLQNEQNALGAIHNAYIPKLLGKGTLQIICDAFPSTIDYLLVEYIPGYTLAYFFNFRKAFPMVLVQYIFYTLLKILSDIHASGYSHLDIKGENIMLDPRTFSIRLVDFGLSAPLRGDQGYGYITGKRGSKYHEAPEMDCVDAKFTGMPVDIFAFGILLFRMLSPIYPFDIASPIDKSYASICQLDFGSFWANYRQLQLHYPTLPDIPDDAKDLLNNMLSPHPMLRFTLSEVSRHRWIRDYKLPQLALLQLQLNDLLQS